MSRRSDIDTLRAVSAIGVVAVHAAAGTVIRGPERAGDAGYTLAVIFDFLGHAAVPVFFAIAGWVLLAGRPVESEVDLRRRMTRIAVPFTVWTLVYAVWGTRDSSLTDTVRILPQALLGAPAEAHLWFLYPYLLLLALVGLVSLLVRRRPVTRASAGVIAFISLAACAPWAVSVLAPRAGLEVASQQWGVPVAWALCTIVGALLLTADTPLSRRSRAGILTGLLGLTAAAVIGCYAFGYGPVLAAAGPMVLLAAAACLALGRGVCLPERLNTPVASLARASFGVYLVHMLVLQTLIFLLAQVSPMLGGAKAWWSIPLLTATTVAVSWALAAGWARLRLSRLLG